MSHTSKPFSITRPLCQARLLLPQGSQDLATLIDTVSDTNIIDNDLALRLPVTVPANGLDGHLIGTVTDQTVPIHMLLSGNHDENIQFHILSSPRHPLFLGFPWL